SFFANLPARHSMLFIAAISIGFVILLPPTIYVLNLIDLFQYGMHINDAAEHIAWAPSLILVLELTALTLRDVIMSAGAKGQEPGRPDRPEPPPRIEELYQRLQEIAGGFVVYWEKNDQEVETAVVPAGNREPAAEANAATLIVEHLVATCDLSD